MGQCARHVRVALTGAAQLIGFSIVKLVALEGSTLLVRGLNCLDGTPLLDLKPDRNLFVPFAPPTPGDFDAESA